MQKIYIEYRKMTKQPINDRSGRTFDHSEIFSNEMELGEFITSDINGILKINSFIKLFLNEYELSGYKLLYVYIDKIKIFDYKKYSF